MKANIHPKYQKVVIRCTTCGSEFETGSTRTNITVDSCSNCHPFYTGQQKFAQATGRVERFNKRLEKKEK